MLHSDIQTQYSALNMGGETLYSLDHTEILRCLTYLDDFFEEILSILIFHSLYFVYKYGGVNVIL